MVGGQFQTTIVGDGGAIGAFRFQLGKIDDQLELTASGSNFIALGDHGPWRRDMPVQLLLGLLCCDCSSQTSRNCTGTSPGSFFFAWRPCSRRLEGLHTRSWITLMGRLPGPPCG